MTKKHLASSLFYYFARISQRLLLCMVVATTAIYWIVEIFAASLITYIHYSPNVKSADPGAVSDEITKAVNALSFSVLHWVTVASALTLILLSIKRFRTHDKPLIVDSIVIAAFCLLSVVFATTIIRTFAQSSGL